MCSTVKREGEVTFGEEIVANVKKKRGGRERMEGKGR